MPKHVELLPGLDEALRDRVLLRLGFNATPPADLAGLHAIYRAWCLRVPFDNVRKMIALGANGTQPLPGGHADSFFENWLATGTGGTCWPTSNALYELLRSLGFDAWRATGAMRDLGYINHATVKVRTEDRDWLADSSLLSNAPLPLDEGVYIHTDPVIPVEVESEDGTHVVWGHTPPNSNHLPCRIYDAPESHAGYLDYYEQSRDRSPFNSRLYARRNRPGDTVVLIGGTQFVKTACSLDRRDLSPEELCEALHRDIGLSGGIIDEWVRSGGLKASLEMPGGPKPPAVTGKPPSQRWDASAASTGTHPRCRR